MYLGFGACAGGITLTVQGIASTHERLQEGTRWMGAILKVNILGWILLFDMIQLDTGYQFKRIGKETDVINAKVSVGIGPTFLNA